jgi:type IX secretion system PorP/SprF family membrane protein
MTWIKIYRNFILLVLLFLFIGNNWSQNVLHRNNYFIQEYLINPAFTGGKDFNPFYMSYRNQFSQLKERPQVFSASGYYIIDPSSNIAGSLYSSETPSFTQLFGELNYSHDYHFSQWAHFTFGGGLIFNQTSQDFSGVEVIDFGDPSLSMGNTAGTAIDGSLGVKYFLKRFKTGISIKNIFESNTSNESSNNLYENKLAREVNFIAQYDFSIDSLLHIEPLFVARRFTQKKENYYNFSLVANYKKLYTLGATYRLNNDFSPNAISLIGGLQYNKFYFLYSHQLFVADADVAGNNTEFTVGYRFPLHPSKVFVDNDFDGVINKKDTCPDVFGPKKYSGCPLKFWAPLLALQAQAEADTLVLDDSLMFRFDKLSSDQLSAVKLFLIDDNGDIIYQAMKTKDGFVFNYLPPTGEYYFKMENMPGEFGFEYLEISYFDDNNKNTMLAHLTKNNGIYMFTRISSDTSDVAKLLIINDDNQVLAVGIQKDGVYVFNHLPEDKNYHYSLVESDSTNNEESFHVSYDFEGQEQTIRTVYHKINGLYKYSPHFIENENFDDLVLSFENETEDYIFNFKKLSSDEAEMTSLVIVDADGNILSTAQKTADGFVFNRIPPSGEYFYKLENMPDGTDIEFMEINIIESGVPKKVVASVDDLKNVFNFQRLSSDEVEMANLVIVDEDGNIISTAEKTDAGFVFNKLPSSGKYFYKLENMPEGSDIEFLEVTIIEDGVEKKIVADVNSKEKLVKLDKTNQTIMNSLRALNNENIKSMSKTEARKRGHYLTVQVGAFKFRMNDETLDFINNNYGDDFHIIKDKRLEYDLYMLGRYKTLSEVKEMNTIIKESGFFDCFIMGVENKSPAPALRIIKNFPGYR